MQLQENFVQEVKEKLERKIYHQYLSNVIGMPTIDTDKLTVLLYVLQSSNKLSKEEIEQYAITVMLIQIALDTHDLVKNDNEFMPTQHRQLTVLAGDYYSGLYYKTLADLSNIQLVKDLAEGIKIVNENKILVYKQEVQTFTEYIDSLKHIETAVFQKLTDYLQDLKGEIIATNYLFLRKLIVEKEQILEYMINHNLKVEHGRKKNKGTLDEMKKVYETLLSKNIKELKEQLLMSIADEQDLIQLLDQKIVNKTQSIRIL